MNMTTTSLTLLLCLILGGCAAFSGRSNYYILQNPNTAEYVNCDVDKWRSEKSYEILDKCIEDYQKQGYVIWSER